MFRYIAMLLACLTAILVASERADAAPYTIVARYAPKKNAPGTKPIEIEVGDNAVVPRSANDYEFQGVFLKLKSDPLSLVQLKQFRDFVAVVKPTPGTVATKIDLDGKSTEVRVLAPTGVDDKTTVAALDINVRAKFDGSYLCAAEMALRMKEGRPAPVAKEKPKDKDKDKTDKTPSDPSASNTLIREDDRPENTDAFASAVLFGRGLRGKDGKVIIYSFCDKVKDQIDWKLVEKIAPSGSSAFTSAQEFHKHQLSLLLIEKLDAAGTGKIVVDRDKPTYPENIFADVSHRFYLLKGVADFALIEVDADEERSFATLIDSASHLELATDGASGICEALPAGCGEFVMSRLVVMFSHTKDGKEVSEKVTLTQLDGKHWRIEGLDLAKHIGDRLTLKILFDAGEDARMELVQRTIRVEQLGIISTPPLYTDLASAFGSDNKVTSDSKFQSSIPVSWGINLDAREASHVAITFPWMIGLNTRHAPHLADVIKIFPHASVIFPVHGTSAAEETINKPRVAFGFGFALANALTFSLGWTVDEDPRRFLLIGISTTDLAKIFRW